MEDESKKLANAARISKLEVLSDPSWDADSINAEVVGIAPAISTGHLMLSNSFALSQNMIQSVHAVAQNNMAALASSVKGAKILLDDSDRALSALGQLFEDAKE